MSLWYRPSGFTRKAGHNPFVKCLCSRCKIPLATWVEQQWYRRRYYCEECVQVTAEWKRREAARAAGGESEPS